MAIAKTIMWLSNKDTFSFYYEDYDDNGNLTDSGYNFNDEYNADMEVSSNDKVYLDDIGVYTKDGDDNKIYHTLVRYFQSYEINKDIKNKFIISIKDGDDESVSDIKISDFGKDGTYSYSDDHLEYVISLVDKNISFKCKDKNGSKTVSNIIIPNYEELFLHTINRTNKIDYNMFMLNNQNKDIDNVNENINAKYNELDSSIEEYYSKIYNEVDDVSKTINELNTDLEDYYEKTNDNIDSAHKDLDDELGNYYDKIEDQIKELAFNVVNVSGNVGSLYAEGVIVKVGDFKGEWKILQQTVYRNDRKMLLILYLVEGVTDGVNKGRKMLVDEKIISYSDSNNS